jgi:cytoskeletal protein CcmA (bactofilin family)
MDNDSSNPGGPYVEQDSLDGPPDNADGTPLNSPAADPSPNNNPSDGPHKSGWKRLIGRFNIYLILFVLVLIIAVAVTLIAYNDSKQGSVTANLSSKGLSASTLAQLANTDTTVGSSNQTLNVESSAIFAGQVLVRQDLDVAGNLDLGGTLSLNDIAISGTTQLAETQINKDLSVAGNTNLQGAVNIAKSLQVNGSGTYSGNLSAPQVTTSSLQLNGDLVLTHHITTGGATPSRTDGSALGNGGTSSISGSDTGGSVAINTGDTPSAGCFININFTSKYNSTPHVLVTPVGSSAGGLSYYINRSATSFSICDATSPPANSSFGFDYFVVD